ncbi:VanZ like protein [Microbacterium sp. SLBN-154]|uniref:VanZ family protein n=1 Tax=Microbacterium sp. SLBN-154 TaxID=2768458 RepID=UPI00117416D3|nr:VanZ family protein [Microbacterium sp. SLBN-154]TQK18503.1 VanZ like protein [Microbacterium sp. SLBN-154]
MTAHPTSSARPRTPHLGALLLLGAYGLALLVIAFWPTPVDRGAGPLLRALTRALPWLTYDVIEFSANILLFVPLGVLLAGILRAERPLMLPVILATTLVVEGGQLLLPERTATLRDVVANTLGGLVGWGIVIVLERRRRRRRRIPTHEP